MRVLCESTSSIDTIEFRAINLSDISLSHMISDVHYSIVGLNLLLYHQVQFSGKRYKYVIDGGLGAYVMLTMFGLTVSASFNADA